MITMSPGRESSMAREIAFRRSGSTSIRASGFSRSAPSSPLDPARGERGGSPIPTSISSIMAIGSSLRGLSDVTMVTSDNPRSEEPMAIIEEILVGMGEPPRSPRAGSRGELGAERENPEARIEVEPDRRKAISRAIELSRPGDMVIIAGKGHETYQEVKGVKHPFDDRVVAREALRQLRGQGSGVRGR